MEDPPLIWHGPRGFHWIPCILVICSGYWLAYCTVRTKVRNNDLDFIFNNAWGAVEHVAPHGTVFLAFLYCIFYFWQWLACLVLMPKLGCRPVWLSPFLTLLYFFINFNIPILPLSVKKKKMFIYLFSPNLFWFIEI